jgi:predicted MFS family arabinose efflux permease
MIAGSVPADRLGAAFGVHRSLDTAGALAGPLITFLLLVWVGTAPQPIFVVSFCFALLGLIVLAGFVRAPAPRPADGAPRPGRREMLALIRDRRLRVAAVVAAVLGLATLSDAFVFLILQRSTGIPLSALPLLPLGTSAAFLIAAAPVGRLADRLGRGRMFVAGHVLLAAAYGLMAAGLPGWAAAVAVLALHGLYYAATDGVLPAWVAELVPESSRASGMAVVQTAQALARFGSSLLVGVLLTVATFGVTLGIAGAAIAAALVGAIAAMRHDLASREGKS